VRDSVQRARLAGATPYAASLLEAPVGLVVLADTSLEKFPGDWVLDCSAAIQNVLLAAHAIGLGGVWLGVYPQMEHVAVVAEIVGAIGEIVPHSMIALGHPAQTPTTVDRFDSAFVREERWE
jgi:nitroreductase